ncbi:hypothetical protein JCGZ_25536 [Jatropha curcas]|uniref:Uncharacterized protein n=1 Tax=Jatropha curcas TaxID=180498 RepID=A0A067JX93_JATCU|nr:11 kDa late embryogenesis abundant protein [Jatropha curcas]KDP24620.1 hypothetical protein JCGZ_25536 [Jatropha curcas]
MESLKETAANVGASAKAGMEKTRAEAQEKVERMSTRDPVQKEMAREKKEERKTEAELRKLEAREDNAAARQAAKAGGHVQYTTAGPGAQGTTETYTHSTTGTTGYPTGTQQMSAMPGHGTGQPYGGEVDPTGLTRTRPSGLPGDTTGHNPRV